MKLQQARVCTGGTSCYSIIIYIHLSSHPHPYSRLAFF